MYKILKRCLGLKTSFSHNWISGNQNSVWNSWHIFIFFSKILFKTHKAGYLKPSIRWNESIPSSRLIRRMPWSCVWHLVQTTTERQHCLYMIFEWALTESLLNHSYIAFFNLVLFKTAGGSDSGLLSATNSAQTSSLLSLPLLQRELSFPLQDI